MSSSVPSVAAINRFRQKTGLSAHRSCRCAACFRTTESISDAAKPVMALDDRRRHPEDQPRRPWMREDDHARLNQDPAQQRCRLRDREQRLCIGRFHGSRPLMHDPMPPDWGFRSADREAVSGSERRVCTLSGPFGTKDLGTHATLWPSEPPPRPRG
jgi:hypothetical protein